MTPCSFIFSAERVAVFLLGKTSRPLDAKEIAYTVSVALDRMGVIYNAAPMRNPIPELRRRELLVLASKQTLLTYLFPIGKLVSHRRPDSSWDIIYDPVLCSLQFIYLG